VKQKEGGAVALSEHEQKLLEQMEQALYAEDPRFAARIRTQGLGRSHRRIILGALGVLAGLSLVVLGVLDQLVWVGAAGFALMVAGAAYAVAPARKAGPQGAVASDGSVKERARARGARGQGFIQRLEERWERRSREDQ
jgi:hypothetical protein